MFWFSPFVMARLGMMARLAKLDGWIHVSNEKRAPGCLREKSG